MPKRIKPDIAPKKQESGHGSPSGVGATQILYVDTKKRVKLEPYNRLRSKCHNGKLGERYVITSGLTYPTCKTCKKVCDTVEIDPKKRVKKAPYITVLKDIPESICRTVPTSRPCTQYCRVSCKGDGDETHVAYTGGSCPFPDAKFNKKLDLILKGDPFYGEDWKKAFANAQKDLDKKLEDVKHDELGGKSFNEYKEAEHKTLTAYKAPKKRVKKEKNEWCYGQTCKTKHEHYHPTWNLKDVFGSNGNGVVEDKGFYFNRETGEMKITGATLSSSPEHTYTISIWHKLFRGVLLIFIGVLLTLAYVKFAYNVHVTDIGDLILLKK